MSAEASILQVEGVSKRFPVRRGLLLRRTVGYVHAVTDVSFALRAGETLGVIGESGCGKTTLARLVLGLEPVSGGSIRFRGHPLEKGVPADVRRHMQMVFQDPHGSLDPRMTVQGILEEPLRVHTRLPAGEKKRHVIEVLQQVGLSAQALRAFPHEFSGGQRQRIAIARALITSPDVLICDEIVSALDVSIQAQIINMLKRLQRERHLSYLFVSHDMAVVRHISDRVLVMYLGRCMEIADKKRLFGTPLHPYTKALLAAVPVPDPTADKQLKPLPGETPSPIQVPPGCPFQTRCHLAYDRCRSEVPVLTDAGGGHRVACHLFQRQELT